MHTQKSFSFILILLLEPEAAESQAAEMTDGKTVDEDGNDVDTKEQEVAEEGEPEPRVSTAFVVVLMCW